VVATAATTLGSVAHGDRPHRDAPVEAAIVIAPQEELSAMARRLQGHRYRLGNGVLVIDDVSDAGRPWVGRVAKLQGQLVLETAVGNLELTGPLARSRILGPGYTVWAIGERRGTVLRVARTGVLRPPPRDRASPLPR
jgi:hypothetical protein